MNFLITYGIIFSNQADVNAVKMPVAGKVKGNNILLNPRALGSAMPKSSLPGSANKV